MLSFANQFGSTFSNATDAHIFELPHFPKVVWSNHAQPNLDDLQTP